MLMHYGKAIRMLRMLKGMSQNKVAKLLSMTQQGYSKIEKKEWISRDKADAILKVIKSSYKDFELVRRLFENDQVPE
jgi:transcriptional regulator with XRE-family HTH domain